MQHHTNILRQKIVLQVTSSWEPIGYKMVRKAFTDLTGDNDPFGEKKIIPAKAFIVEYDKDADGMYDFDKLTELRPVEWEEWIQQPIRGHDSVVHTPKRQIRVPTVIMSSNISTVPTIKKKRPTNKDILIRDNYVCQYSGRACTPDEITVDHVISKDEWKRRGLPGTPDTWENLVACYKKINHQKSNKSVEEAGLKLIRKPRAPAAVCLSELIREIRHRDWKHFFTRLQDKRVTIGESFAA